MPIRQVPGSRRAPWRIASGPGDGTSAPRCASDRSRPRAAAAVERVPAPSAHLGRQSTGDRRRSQRCRAGWYTAARHRKAGSHVSQPGRGADIGREAAVQEQHPRLGHGAAAVAAPSGYPPRRRVRRVPHRNRQQRPGDERNCRHADEACLRGSRPRVRRSRPSAASTATAKASRADAGHTDSQPRRLAPRRARACRGRAAPQAALADGAEPGRPARQRREAKVASSVGAALKRPPVPRIEPCGGESQGFDSRQWWLDGSRLHGGPVFRPATASHKRASTVPATTAPRATAGSRYKTFVVGSRNVAAATPRRQTVRLGIGRAGTTTPPPTCGRAGPASPRRPGQGHAQQARAARIPASQQWSTTGIASAYATPPSAAGHGPRPIRLSIQTHDR